MNAFESSRLFGKGLLAVLLACGAASSVQAQGLTLQEREMIRDSWIFVFHASVPRSEVAGLAQRAAAEGGANVGHVYQHSIRGFSARMPAQAAAQIAARNPSVKYYEADQIARADAKPGGGGSSPAQTVPWGIARVKGGSGKTCTGKAWVIDTGIDLTHPDLNVDTADSRNFVSTGKSTFSDGNGHGTHVAGIIGAKDNGIGVIGVCPGASVIAIRVLNNQGSGTWSDVLAGIDWVGGHGVTGDVANMSLGGGYSQAINDAVVAASSSDPNHLNPNGTIKFAIAAGNSSTNASTTSPASANGANISTVSAFDSFDYFATSFSNYGNPPIDFGGPGVGIYSTYKDGTYKTLSGTSMAAPHIAGVLLLGGCTVKSYVKNDPDGHADPICEVGP